MKRTHTIEVVLISMMLLSTLVIFTSMAMGDIVIFAIGFNSFLYSAFSLIVTPKK